MDYMLATLQNSFVRARSLVVSSPMLSAIWMGVFLPQASPAALFPWRLSSRQCFSAGGGSAVMQRVDGRHGSGCPALIGHRRSSTATAVTSHGGACALRLPLTAVGSWGGMRPAFCALLAPRTLSLVTSLLLTSVLSGSAPGLGLSTGPV